MSRRVTTYGNSRSHEVSSRSHRRDAAWRDYVHGTRIEPMPEPGWWARLMGRG